MPHVVSLSMGEEQRATKRRGLCVGWNVKCVYYDLLQNLLLLALPTSRSIDPLAEQYHKPTTLRDVHPLPFRKLPSVLAAQCVSSLFQMTRADCTLVDAVNLL